MTAAILRLRFYTSSTVQQVYLSTKQATLCSKPAHRLESFNQIRATSRTITPRGAYIEVQFSPRVTRITLKFANAHALIPVKRTLYHSFFLYLSKYMSVFMLLKILKAYFKNLISVLNPLPFLIPQLREYHQ